MSVAFDAVGPSSSGTSATSGPLTWAHVCGASATDIVITATTNFGGTNAVTGVTYGGQTCSLIAFVASGGTTSGGVAMYYLASPPTGSNTVSVSYASGSGTIIGGSMSFTGGGSHGTGVTAQPAGVSSVSGSVTGTTTGGMICAVTCMGNNTGTFSGTNGVTVQWQDNVDSNTASDNACGGTVASTGGGANQTVGFSKTVSDDWGLVAVEILPGSSSSAKSGTDTSSGAEGVPALVGVGDFPRWVG